MANATVTFSNLGRNSVIGTLAAIKVTVAGNGATYATATGGLPIDLATVLNNAQPNDSESIIQPDDIVGIIPAPSTNLFLAAALAISASTSWTKTTLSSGYGSDSTLPAPMSVRPNYKWLSVPATIRLYATGAASAGALGEFADGANSDTVTFLLLYTRGGANL